MLQNTQTVKHVVTRDGAIISDGYDTLDLARQQRQHLLEQHQALSLDVDLAVAEVTVKTTLSKPKIIPDPEPIRNDEPIEVQGTGATLADAADDLAKQLAEKTLGGTDKDAPTTGETGDTTDAKADDAPASHD